MPPEHVAVRTWQLPAPGSPAGRLSLPVSYVPAPPTPSEGEEVLVALFPLSNTVGVFTGNVQVAH